MVIVIGKMLGLHGPEAAKASNFGGSRDGLAVKCMQRVREVAKDEEEADRYSKHGPSLFCLPVFDLE